MQNNDRIEIDIDLLGHRLDLSRPEAVVALKGIVDAPVTTKGYGLVGALRSPWIILRTIKAVYDERAASEGAAHE